MRESSRPYALPLMYLYFCLTTLLGLNLLIAMMAETFTKVSTQSFQNHAFSFGKVVVKQCCTTSSVPPLNLFGIPYYLGSWVKSIAAGRDRGTQGGGLLANGRCSAMTKAKAA